MNSLIQNISAGNSVLKLLFLSSVVIINLQTSSWLHQTFRNLQALIALLKQECIENDQDGSNTSTSQQDRMRATPACLARTRQRYLM